MAQMKIVAAVTPAAQAAFELENVDLGASRADGIRLRIEAVGLSHRHRRAGGGDCPGRARPRRRQRLEAVGPHVTEGDRTPDSFTPELFELHLAEQLPLERFVRTYPTSNINQSIVDQHDSPCVKVVLLAEGRSPQCQDRGFRKGLHPHDRRQGCSRREGVRRHQSGQRRSPRSGARCVTRTVG